MSTENMAKLHEKVVATEYRPSGLPLYDEFYHHLNDYKSLVSHEEAAALANRCIVAMARSKDLPFALLQGYSRLTSLCHWRARQLLEQRRLAK